ncbi:hypothetical protein CAEBREN_01144 [Caenorhabditis brenneri]|uniref:F-box domain-containing protein n=1 Tax=Caenorhabditis brenneri TaxID=135651 RepID=G0PK97_CAEBE|nr:hypothetical protein CAEBREN_01144 [Caenorhabditis brenneri]
MEVEKFNSLSLEEWPTLTQPVVKKCEFDLTIPFHRLPLLVQVQVVQTMGLKDWINLAMTSKRNERVLKLARIKTESPCVEICLNACIKFSSLKLNLCYDNMHWKTKKWEMMNKEDMKSWLNGLNSSMIENAAILYQKMQNVFVFPNNLTIDFCTDFPRKATIRELLSNPGMKNWKDLTIYGKTISSEDLRMIMDTATLHRTFNSAVEKMPLGFKHENAFRFFHQIYHDARWVKMEDLYGLRNLVYVSLYRNLFTHEQLKSFVNYWVNSEVDMFSVIQIETDPLNFENLIDGFHGLQGSGPNSELFFTLSKSSSKMREQTMLRISYDVMEKCLLLEAWYVDEKYTPSENDEENKKFENVGLILTLLRKKKKLEDLREEASEEAKLKVNKKINKLIAALSELNVIFINGKATHELF